MSKLTLLEESRQIQYGLQEDVFVPTFHPPDLMLEVIREDVCYFTGRRHDNYIGVVKVWEPMLNLINWIIQNGIDAQNSVWPECYRPKKVKTEKSHTPSDYDQRLKLAKMIGLDEVPELDDNAIDNISGMFSDIFDDDDDAVELIRDVRD